MSVVMFVLGALCAFGGAVAILFGLPVKEFSFGNTLILAGTTALVGGLIVIALGAAIAQLHRIVDMLGARPLSRSGRPLEPFERPGVQLGQGKIPFPPKPKTEQRPSAVVAQPEQESDHDIAPRVDPIPSLHNPDVSLVAADDAEELPLSPRHAGTTRPVEAAGETSHEPIVEPEQPPPDWRTPPPPRPATPNYFENMWPSAERSPPAPEPVPSRAETIPRAPVEAEIEPPIEDRDEPVSPVAVLKSGVVDGMSYTLYVDGSIEAKLPEGTLHFASINELRTHLEQNP